MQAKKDSLNDLGRLKKRSDFLRLSKSGQKWVSDSVILQLVPRKEGGGEAVRFKYGLTVTKKLGHAPKRNMIKRRLRAALSDVLFEQKNEKLDHLFANFDWDMVLIGRHETDQISYQKLKRDLMWCLKRSAEKIKMRS